MANLRALEKELRRCEEEVEELRKEEMHCEDQIVAAWDNYEEAWTEKMSVVKYGQAARLRRAELVLKVRLCRHHRDLQQYHAVPKNEMFQGMLAPLYCSIYMFAVHF